MTQDSLSLWQDYRHFHSLFAQKLTMVAKIERKEKEEFDFFS
jgi:hypothetical protein